MDWTRERKQKPETNKRVLICDVYGEIRTGYYDGEIWFTGESPYFDMTVTNWMNFPSKPKNKCCDPEKGCLCNK